MKIIKQGAEAKIILLGNKILKKRISKKYRIKEIDKEFIRKRTRREAKMMREVRRLGINVPQIIEVDEKNGEIFMEYINSPTLKEKLNLMKKDEIKKVAKKIGEVIATLHANNIIHGDITTSNILIKDSKLFFIDFGLSHFSSKIEEKAEDLLVFYYALTSTHKKLFNLFWKSFLSSYIKKYKKGEEVLKRLEKIKKRVRYVLR